MTTPPADEPQPVPTVEDALATAEQAQRDKDDAHAKAQDLVTAVTDLENRLRAGDRTVTVLELGEAQAKARHALLLAESHEAAVQQAYDALMAAKYYDSANRLAALDKRFQKTLDRLAGPISAKLAELLSELETAHTEHQDCARTLLGVHQAMPDIPPSITLNHGAANRYKSAVALPDVDVLVGELLAAAIETAFGADRARSKCIQITGTVRVNGGTDAYQLAHQWIGARKPNAGNGNRPQYVTVDRA